MTAHLTLRGGAALLLAFVAAMTPLRAVAQTSSTAKPGAPGSTATAAAPIVPAGVTPPADYVIGPNDVLSIAFWREDDLSGEATVRPDGMISLKLLNDIPAAGLTPEQLRVNLTEAAKKFVSEPTVAVIVKEINSRRVYITGQVAKPGPYPLMAPVTVMQLITMAGGVAEYADKKNILITRTEKGKTVAYKFNYDDYSKGKRLEANIELKPGDQVIVR